LEVNVNDLLPARLLKQLLELPSPAVPLVGVVARALILFFGVVVSLYKLLLELLVA
jgi:hypothetical protein